MKKYLALFPAGNYLFKVKVKNGNTRPMCETCSKLTIKTSKRRYELRSDFIIVNFEQIQKQPPEYSIKETVLKNLTLFTEKHLCWGLQSCNFITKRLQHRCFPVNITKFLRTDILKNICERLFCRF